MGEDFGVPEAVRAAFFYREMIVLCRIRALAVRFKGGDQRGAGLERFFKTFHIARQSVIKAVQRPDIENDLLLRYFLTSLVRDPDRLDLACKIRSFMVVWRYENERESKGED